MEVGCVLNPVVKEITLQSIQSYAEVSGDRNPLHCSSDVADDSLLRGVSAHGMMTVAFVSQMMGEAFGEAWLTGGEIEVSFRAPVRPGSTLEIAGSIAERIVQKDGVVFVCDISCRTRSDEVVATAKTRVLVPW